MFSLVVHVGLRVFCSAMTIFPPSANFAKRCTFWKSLPVPASIVQPSTLGRGPVKKILYSPARTAILPPMAKFVSSVIPLEAVEVVSQLLYAPSVFKAFTC